ncbi:MAG TPA: MarR family winged helix-turn-helix transcriptional regulator [Aquirhabdus sp.]
MPKSEKVVQHPLLKSEYEALSEFRYQLRRFLHFSEQAARSGGLTPLQYQLLLHVQGFPGRNWATVGDLAERLQMKPHGTVALISRCEESGLVRRQTGTTDRRQVEIRLLPAGEKILERLAGLHKTELRSLKGTFRVDQITNFNDDDSDVS